MENLITIILVAVVVGLVVGIVVYRCSEAKVEQRIKDEKSQWDKTLEATVARINNDMRGFFGTEMTERSRTFETTNCAQVKNLLQPMEIQLDELKKMVTDNTTDRKLQVTTLTTTIANLKEHDEKRDKITQELTNALKRRGKVQGDWGEQVLESILIDSGLREEHEFYRQMHVMTDDKNTLIPDVVIKQSDNSFVLIDSKVSLTAYTNYVNAETEDERDKAMKANYKSIEDHVTELSDKHYETIIPNSVPFVLMFVPNEGSYTLAMNYKPQLAVDAWRKNVLIINPINLTGILYIISVTWKNIRMDKNVRKILDSAQAIYDKYTNFAESFVDLGTHLARASNAYDKGKDQLIEGRGNLGKNIQKLIDLGVTKKKEIPEELQPCNDTDKAEE